MGSAAGVEVGGGWTGQDRTGWDPQVWPSPPGFPLKLALPHTFPCPPLSVPRAAAAYRYAAARLLYCAFRWRFSATALSYHRASILLDGCGVVDVDRASLSLRDTWCATVARCSACNNHSMLLPQRRGIAAVARCSLLRAAHAPAWQVKRGCYAARILQLVRKTFLSAAALICGHCLHPRMPCAGLRRICARSA